MAIKEVIMYLISNFQTIFVAIIFLLAINLFFVYRVRRKANQRYDRLQLPPGPKPWPLIGNLPELILKKPTFRWIHHFMQEMNTEIACVRFGNIHVIPVSSAKIAVELLRKKDAIFASRPTSFATHMFSRGYKTATVSPFGDQSKKMRKVLTSEIICPEMHRRLLHKRAREADHLLHYVFNKCNNSEDLDIRMVTRHYCANLIRSLVFSKRYFGKAMPDGGPGADEIEHVNAMFNSLEYMYAFSISDYFPQLIGLNLDGHETIIKASDKTYKKLHDPIVDERIHLLRENEELGAKLEPQDYLDVLIMLRDEEGRPLLTPDEIKAQSTEIMTVGVDNPSNAVEWILAEMMNNPEILRKAVNEIDSVVGKERLVHEADIPQLKYLKACIREAFRVHPIAPFNVPHVAMEDTDLAGYFIPKGSHVLLSRLGLGRNPNIWDKPLQFKPERHLNSSECSEVVLTEPDLRFISFSAGRRGCIAVTLGTAMTVMLLARLLQGFTWSKPRGISTIDLAESYDNLYLAKPLVLQAHPRLPSNMYSSN